VHQARAKLLIHKKRTGHITQKWGAHHETKPRARTKKKKQNRKIPLEKRQYWGKQLLLKGWRNGTKGPKGHRAQTEGGGGFRDTIWVRAHRSGGRTNPGVGATRGGDKGQMNEGQRGKNDLLDKKEEQKKSTCGWGGGVWAGVPKKKR